jgi:3'-phosphoadenosine 5'-phosphosulfate sulfotransferase (PAPS reductase)/FAD synthetase
VKHIVFDSGGIGSYSVLMRLIPKVGKENIIRLFTDTLIESPDLYRFQGDVTRVTGIPLTRLVEGRTPWEVFKDKRFIGNSRLAHCSHILKQEPATKWVHDNFNPDECILYLGIDWTESHRTKAPTENYAPYKVEFPMCEEPYVTKDEMLAELASVGIEIPELYKRGYSHNNCGGFCVRAGQGHFAHLLKDNRELYLHHEEKEQEMREYLGKDYSILKRTKMVWKDNGHGGRFKDRVIHQLTLNQLREELESNQTDDIDFQDVGGCGCFVNI